MKRGIISSYWVQLLFLLRPWQWVKNIAVFIPIIFTERLFVPGLFTRSLIAFCSLCLLSSSHYVMNDIVDRKKDQEDPIRKFRPIASGIISISTGWTTWIILVLMAVSIAFRLGNSFVLAVFIYSLIHYLLLFVFRHMTIIDIFVLAIGYVMRLYVGEAATGVHVSVWLILSAFCLSLLVAVGKRRYDYMQKNESIMDRYTVRLLDSYVTMFATATFLSYVYYTFLSTFTFEAIRGTGVTIGERKWLMITIPFVLYGIMRFLQRIYIDAKGNFQKTLMTDIPLLFSVCAWGSFLLFILYALT